MAEHPEAYNLAQDLNEAERGEIAEQVLEDAKNDDQSRKPWRVKHAEYIKLFNQMDEPKNPPWEGASEESIPIMTEACVQFSARAYAAMFPNNKIIQAIPQGKVDEAAKERAERVTRHMTFQLIERDTLYKEDKDALLLSLSIHGSYFTKTYHDGKRNVVENVRAEDLIVPYGVGPRKIEDVERKTHVVWKSVNWTKIQEDSGYFVDHAEAYQGQEKPETQVATEKADGVTDPLYRVEGRPCKIYEQHRLLDMDNGGIAYPYIATVDVESKKLLRLVVGYEVDDEGQPTNDREVIQYFTHYGFLPNPDGFYHWGMGHLIGKMNTAVNKMLREIVDAGELANAGNMGGFISSALNTKGEETELSLGKFIKVPQTVDDIRKAIYQFSFPGPNAALFQTMDELKSSAQRLATITEAITGQTDAVMQPTALLALIEQSLQVFSSVYERIFRSWTSELQKYYRLNRRYLDESEFFTVLDQAQGFRQFESGKADYADDMQIRPVADPRMSTQKQKFAQAEAEWAFLSQNALVMQSPQHYRNASVRYLQTLGTEGIDELIPQPQEQKPERVDDPQSENMAALFPLPQVPEVFPDQDHIQHLESHEAFIAGEYGSRLTPEGMKAINDHIQKHITFMYGANETDGQIGNRELAAEPGNGGIPQTDEGTVPPGVESLGELGGIAPGEGPG
ncbi:MAG: hypothetical protein J3T61_00250 [Candidatus Brocadiales bacterium]|nr:hypothetical protein [Candidatus Bathyanammoxibius sp.]